MNKAKILFCLFLLIISYIYIDNKIKEINIFNLLTVENKKEELIKEIVNNSYKPLKTNNIVKKEIKEEKEITEPIVYFYNTHQTEEYGKTAYNITPTVQTVSNMLKDELSKYNINSLVETKSVPKALKESGEDYPYTYEITLNFLKERQKEYKTLNYYFDIHRDSIKGQTARVKINNKSYAKIMFLIGSKNPNYKKNESHIKKMTNYLNKHYKGILRDIYYQPLYCYNQDYDENMFLVEFGGVDNTLEEIYNSSQALSEAINHLIGGKNAK